MSAANDFGTAYGSARVVVLGAAGFIGRWVARALSRRAARLHLVVRDRDAAVPVFAEYGVRGDVVQLDLRASGVLAHLIEAVRPCIVFNLAGYGIDRRQREERSAFALNAGVLDELSEAVAQHRDPTWSGCDIVHAGSMLEYGPIGGDLSEDSTPRPTTLYGQSKLAGTQALERWCLRCGLKAVTARLFTVYGPGEHTGRLLPALLETAHTGRPLRLSHGTQRRDFTYVEDVADGLLRLGVARSARGEVVNLATGRLTPVRSFVEIAARLLGIPPDHLQFGAIATPTEEIEHTGVCLARLQRLTAWIPPTSIPTGIDCALAFARKQRDHHNTKVAQSRPNGVWGRGSH